MMKKEQNIVIAAYFSVIAGIVLSYFLSLVGYGILVLTAGLCLFVRGKDFTDENKNHINLILRAIGFLAVLQLLSVVLALTAIDIENLKVMGILVLMSQILRTAGFMVPLFKVVKGLKRLGETSST
ncbi:hypothetical protein [Vibrio penaeicida]|uniref:hypothetical protein n=1 Tax=Vibrio penaeicida TaxID=104609 RepID=UPI0011AB8E77|nr:hypothetical protein [Vibrio penaeicida]